MFNYKKYDKINFKYTKPVLYKKPYYRINVYDKKEEKIILQTPRMDIAFTPTDHSICVSFCRKSVDKSTRKFYNFLKTLDKINKKKIDSKWKYRKNVMKFVGIKYMNLNKSRRNFNVYNKNSIQIDKNHLQKGVDISAIIELEYIWINKKKKTAGCQWTVLQVKTYNKLNLNKCLIIDDDPKIIKNKAYQKYIKMAEMGVPIMAVKNNMIRDGINKDIINDMPLEKKQFIKQLGNTKSPNNKQMKPTKNALLGAISNLRHCEKNENKNNKSKNKRSNGFAPSLDDIKSIITKLKKPEKKMDLLSSLY